jgi:hypothetical protein
MVMVSDPHIGKENVGKISERIIANELEACGFLVRDLNLEGISANADLLAIKDQSVWQIQVKGSTYNETYPNNGWWFQYGYCHEEHILNPDARMFNRAKGPLKANVVAMVCVRSPHEYQCIILPVEGAEFAAKINLDYAYRTKKKDGKSKKPNKVWFCEFISERSEYSAQMKEEWKTLEPFLIDRSREDLKGKGKDEAREKRKLDADKVSSVIARAFELKSASDPSLRG